MSERIPERYPLWYVERFPPEYVAHRIEEELPLRDFTNEDLYLRMERICERLDRIEAKIEGRL